MIRINVINYDKAVLTAQCGLAHPKTTTHCCDGAACPAYDLLLTGPHGYLMEITEKQNKDGSQEFVCDMSGCPEEYAAKSVRVINWMCYTCEHRIQPAIAPGAPGEFENNIYNILHAQMNRCMDKNECPAVLAERASKIPSGVVNACKECYRLNELSSLPRGYVPYYRSFRAMVAPRYPILLSTMCLTPLDQCKLVQFTKDKYTVKRHCTERPGDGPLVVAGYENRDFMDCYFEFKPATNESIEELQKTLKKICNECPLRKLPELIERQKD